MSIKPGVPCFGMALFEPRIPRDLAARLGEEAVRVLSDGKRMLRRLIEGRWLTAHAVVGLYPANSRGDDIVLWRDETRSEPVLTWHGLRQQTEKPTDSPNRCLSDFVAPVGQADYVGVFAVTHFTEAAQIIFN